MGDYLNRQIIGKAFIEVFEEQAKQEGDISYLAQGAIYPDAILRAEVSRSRSKRINLLQC